MEKFFDESGSILKALATILVVSYLGCNVLAESSYHWEAASYWTALACWLMLTVLAVFFTIVAVVIGVHELTVGTIFALQAAIIVAGVRRAKRQTVSYKWASMVADRILPPKRSWLIRLQQRTIPRRPVMA